jgi:hypothetical protein
MNKAIASRPEKLFSFSQKLTLDPKKIFSDPNFKAYRPSRGLKLSRARKLRDFAIVFSLTTLRVLIKRLKPLKLLTPIALCS